MQSAWNEQALASRVKSVTEKIRYEGGSPNSDEIAAYAKYLPENTRFGLVLGMTPELRNLAAKHCDCLISVDQNERAINLYADWLDDPYRSKETIIQADWSQLESLLTHKVGFILGDGIFGNIIPLAAYGPLIDQLLGMLENGGRFITRQALFDQAFNGANYKQALLDGFRQGHMNAAEFGLSMRLQGYTQDAYQHSDALLDNKSVYDALERDVKAGMITAEEQNLIRHYYFTGVNTLPSQRDWEAILQNHGCQFTSEPLKGRNWYSWYPVYSIQAE